MDRKQTLIFTEFRQEAASSDRKTAAAPGSDRGRISLRLSNTDPVQRERNTRPAPRR